MTTRRRFLQGAAGTGALALLPRQARAAVAQPATATALPDPSTAPFEHVVVLMFENRSFDHLLGWLEGADGVQDGLAFTDQTGTTYPTYELAADTQGCDYRDPDHSWEGFDLQRNGGALDGWLRAPAVRGAADTFPIGYYTEGSVPVLGSLAKSYTTLDRYFASIQAETFPNRFYQHAARTDRDHNLGITQTTLSPTIWDRVAGAGLTGGYYFVDEPFLGLWGAKYATLLKPAATFLADCAAGTLPNVSFVDPSFAGEDEGASGDYHPHGDIRAGESFLSTIYHAVRSSPLWSKTVLVINFDEWGGFYDHVAPPKVVDDTVAAALGPGPDHPDYTQLGFRVPCVVVSPFSPAKVVNDGPYEHTSVLKMIEWRWGLAPLTARDANARNLAEVLDFSVQRTDSPPIPTLASLASIPCGPTSTAAVRPQALSGPSGASGPSAPTGPTTTTTATVVAPTTTGSGTRPGAAGLARTGDPLADARWLAAATTIAGGMALRAAYRQTFGAADLEVVPVTDPDPDVEVEVDRGRG